MADDVKKVKKRKIPTFKRPNYGAKGRSRVKDTWRSQRGNDNHMRIKKKNVGVMPMIGYKNSDDARFVRPDGTRELVVHNAKDFEHLEYMTNYYTRPIIAKFAHDLSRKKRAELQKIADSKKIRVANGFKAEKQEKKQAVNAEPAKKEDVKG